MGKYPLGKSHHGHWASWFSLVFNIIRNDIFESGYHFPETKIENVMTIAN